MNKCGKCRFMYKAGFNCTGNCCKHDNKLVSIGTVACNDWELSTTKKPTVPIENKYHYPRYAKCVRVGNKYVRYKEGVKQS